MIHPKQRAAYEEARSLIGLKEIKGAEDAPEIVSFFEEVGHDWVKDDETAWCAAFVGAMLRRAGMQGTGKLNARSYLDWGEEVALEDAEPGDIVVFWRGQPNGWQGHVGFYVSHGASAISVLGGNQGNEVSVKPYRMERFLGVRRVPAPAAPARQVGTNLLSVLINFLGGLFGGKRT